MSVIINIEFLPCLFIDTVNLVLREEQGDIKVEISKAQLEKLYFEYTWVELGEVPNNLRYRLNSKDIFSWEGKQWIVIKKQEFDIIKDLSNKTEFSWNNLPQEIKTSGLWELVEIEGEWVVYLEQEDYNQIKREYRWVQLGLIPERQRQKIKPGNIVNIEGEWVAILNRSTLSTIFRKYQVRG